MTDATDPMADLGRQLKPYRDQFPSFAELPADGMARTEVAALIVQAVVGNPYLSLGVLVLAGLAGLALATRLPARGAAALATRLPARAAAQEGESP